jgi:hypothetical protein
MLAMRRLIAAATLVALVTLPAAAQVEPAMVGMWQLQWAGQPIYWQVRADGIYRLMGTGARPNEHWGRMQAANGQWSSQWERGADRGTYRLNGATWTVTGSLGPGTWQRIWPGQKSSASPCPYFDVAVVEAHFASAVETRMIGGECEFSATKVGISDGLSIEVEPADSMDTMRLHRAACASGTNTNPSIRCVTGLGDAAFFYMNGALHAYRGGKKAVIGLGTFPKNPPLNDADAIALARIALQRF